jgi:predicted DNA binding CopG/RHH family protein
MRARAYPQSIEIGGVVSDMPGKAKRPKVPAFKTEREEARWWDENKEMIERNLISAMKDGTAQRGTAVRLAAEARASKNITIRLPIADIERAQNLSAVKGLRYQTFIKMLLHEALDREEKRRTG